VKELVVSVCVSELTGVTTEIATALYALGIIQADQLLAASGGPADRAELALTLGIDATSLLEIANRAELTRIEGLTTPYLELLALASVDRVAEVRRRIPENLYMRVMALAAQQRICPLPRLDDVQRWVSEAKQLQRAVHY